MDPLQYHDQYRRNDISTSSQRRLIIMMYEGAIKFTTMAIDCIDKGNIVGQGKYISKTHDIINELSLVLDIKKGGEVAQRLESLYQYMLSQLTLANIKSDKKTLESIIKILSTLIDGWEQLFDASSNTGREDLEPPKKNIVSKC